MPTVSENAVRAIPELAAKALNKYRAARAAAHADQDMTMLARDQRISAARDEAAASIANLRSTYDQHGPAARAEVQKNIRPEHFEQAGGLQAARVYGQMNDTEVAAADYLKTLDKGLYNVDMALNAAESDLSPVGYTAFAIPGYSGELHNVAS